MSDKKHIDRLFQEKLKDFEVAPSDAVWQNINTKLHNNSEVRRVVPLWLKITGIAAGLVLLFTIGNMVVNNETNPSNDTIVDTEINDSKNAQEPNQDLIDLNETFEEDVASEDNSESIESASENVNSTIGNQNNLKINSNRNLSTSVVSHQNDEKNNKGKLLSSQNKEINDATVKNKDNSVVADNNTSKSIEQKELLEPIDKQKTDALINDISIENNEVIAEESAENEINEESNIQLENKVSLTEEIAKTEEVVEDDDESEKIQRWSISPMVAPVYYTTLGKGSTIDSQFDNNSRTGDLNMSYGVAANYNVSKKLSVRAGINNLKVGYSTNNVIVYSNIQPNVDITPLKNVRLNEVGQSFSFLSGENFNVAQVPGVVSDNIKSSLNQALGFIEVPLEVEYKLSDNKFGMSLIGGFSTLFLTHNEVSTELQGNRTMLGESTNINNTSFSANLGLGFNYKISEKINLNLDPTVKYQINTFNDTSGSFNPYVIGFYTGISFKF